MATRHFDQRAQAKVRTHSSLPRRAVEGNPTALLLPAILIFYASMLPSEIRLSLADLTFYPPRLVGFAMLPFIILRAFRDPVRWCVWDGLFGLSAFWMVFAFMNYYGASEGSLRGLALALDAIIPYLAARVSIRDRRDLMRFLVYAAPGAGLVAITLIIEVVAGQWLIRPAFAALLNPLPTYQDGIAVGARGFETESRLGLIRATGPFAHPILAGLFLSSLLVLFIYSGLRSWPKIVGVLAALAAILTGSSAAYLGLIIGVGIVFTDKIQKIVRFLNWTYISLGAAIMLLIGHFITENGIFRFLARFSLNPQTAYYRTLIWDYGTESVLKHPLFGIGFSSYEREGWMPASVDAHWLMLAIRFGLVPSLGILSVAVAAIILVAVNARSPNIHQRNLSVGLAASIFSVIIGGFTVAFFGGIEAWVYMLVAIGISVGMATRAEKRAFLPPHASRKRATQLGSSARTTSVRSDR